MVTLAIPMDGPEELGILPVGSLCVGYGSPYALLGGGIVLAKRMPGYPPKSNSLENPGVAVCYGAQSPCGAVPWPWA